MVCLILLKTDTTCLDRYMLQTVQSHGSKSSNMIIQGDVVRIMRDLIKRSVTVHCIVIDLRREQEGTLADFMERIQLSRRLLAPSGILWVMTCPDTSHYIKIKLDTVFGRNNFIADCAWDTWDKLKTTDMHLIAPTTDHVLVYSRCKTKTRLGRFERTAAMDQAYQNPDNDPRGPWRTNPLSCPLMGSHGESYHLNNEQTDFIYPIQHPGGYVIMPPGGRCWKTTQQKAEKMIEDGRVIFTKNNLRLKTYLNKVKGKVPSSWWTRDMFGTYSESAKESNQFGTFDNNMSRPEKVFRRIFMMSTVEGDTILDITLCNAASAAVAHKMKRTYIGLSPDDQCISRLLRVIQGEQGGVSKSVEWKGGGGFTEYQWNDDGSHTE